MFYVTTHGIRIPLRGVVTAGAVMCMTFQAAAATSDGVFAARGIGAQSCDTVAGLRGEERQAVVASLASWIAGYVSHANRTTADNFEVSPVVDNGVLAEMVAQFCAQNRQALVEAVFASVLQSMHFGSQQSETELVELRNGDSVLLVRSGAVVQVQQALADRELLNHSDVDGAFGPKTSSALLTYQEAETLPRTGLPDALTMLSLFGAAQAR